MSAGDMGAFEAYNLYKIWLFHIIFFFIKDGVALLCDSADEREDVLITTWVIYYHRYL